MPVIKLEYDDTIVGGRPAREFCDAIRKIVIDATGRPESEVCVYANSAQIKINIAPIQVWLEMSDHKIANVDALAKDIRKRISEWKAVVQFPHSIKFTLTPMTWNIGPAI